MTEHCVKYALNYNISVSTAAQSNFLVPATVGEIEVDAAKT